MNDSLIWWSQNLRRDFGGGQYFVDPPHSGGGGWAPLFHHTSTDWLPGSPYRRNFSSCHICTKSQRTSTYLYAVLPITILWLHVFTKFGSWWYNSSWSIFFDVQGAFWGMVIGHSVGISRMVLDFIYPSPKCGKQDTRPGVVANIHFTYFSVLVLGLSWAVCLFVSLFTKAPSKDAVRLGGTRWGALFYSIMVFLYLYILVYANTTILAVKRLNLLDYG